MIIIIILIFLSSLVMSEVVVYTNDTYTTNGFIQNATETGIYSPCIYNQDLYSARPSNCISGTDRMLIGKWPVATPRLFYNNVPVYYYNESTFTYSNSNYFGIFQNITDAYWLGALSDGTTTFELGGSTNNCFSWTSSSWQAPSYGLTGQNKLESCYSQKKVYCSCLVSEESIPGTTRTPSANPTVNPTRLPSKSPTNPTFSPSKTPTFSPSKNPSKNPTTTLNQMDSGSSMNEINILLVLILNTLLFI
jgi:hypothetical protein